MAMWTYMQTGVVEFPVMPVLAQDGGLEVIGQPTGGAPVGEAPGGEAGGAAGPPAAGGSAFQFIMFMLLGLLVFMIVSQIIAGRRQRREREQMLGAMRRNDRVQTIGGIIGTVAEVRDKEVVLRVDDSNKTRIRFAKSAIQQVLSSGGGGSQDGEAGEAVEPKLEPERVGT